MPHTIVVRLFAGASQVAGADSVSLELAEEATVQQLREQLETQCPALRDFAHSAAIAIDAEYAGPRSIVPKGSEVALIPPVSGG